jgi:undecaprenyl-diphosphatase
MIRTDKKLFNLIPISLLLAAVLFLIALFVFSFVAHEVVFEREDLFDSRVFGFFKKHLSPGEISVLHFITFFGSHWFLFPAYTILIIVYLARKHTQDAIDIGVIGLTSMVLLFSLKHWFHRARPDLPLFRQ